MEMTANSITPHIWTGAGAVALVEGPAPDPSSYFDGVWSQGLLRSARASGAGMAVIIAGYGPYLPHVGTSPTVVDLRSIPYIVEANAVPQAPSVYQEVLSLPVADQAKEVLAALSLNKSQLADVLGVSRPTLYDWFDGAEPNAANAGRLATLMRLLTRMGISSEHPLNARFVRQPLSEAGKSLLEVLCADTLDEVLISDHLRGARALGENAAMRRRTRDDRLQALGYDTPSDEQRRDQLARNIATQDWPTIEP